MFELGEYRPKERISTEYFVVRKLAASDAEIDFAAVISSVDIIKKQRGGTWPSYTITIEEDVIDLGWHQREFESGGSFAYVITNLNEDEEMGCIYFYPPGHAMNSSGANLPKDCDVCVNFWVSQKYFDLGYYDKVYSFVQEWLKGWPFENTFISNPMKPSNKV